MRKWLLALLALTLMSLPSIAQDELSVYIRAAHFSVDAPEVDIYVNSELAHEALDFPEVSEWIEVEIGSYTVDIVPTGGTIEDAILSETYDFSSGDWATLTVIGEVSRDALTIQPLIDNFNNIPDGLTYVSAFHAISDLTSVDVFVGDVNLASGLSYPSSTEDSDGYAGDVITSGDYAFDIQDADGESLLTFETRTLSAGQAYFVAAVGTAANPSLVFVVTDVEALTGNVVDPLGDVETGSGSLLARIGHFSVSAPEVDLYINGELTLETLQFGDLTDYMAFDAGIYDVALVPTGESSENSIYQGRIALIADSITLIAAIGFVGNDSVEVVTALENTEAPTTGNSRVAFFQAIPSASFFNLNVNGSILIQGVVYPSIFEDDLDGYAPVDIVAGAYEFVVEGAGNTLNIGNVTTGAGRVYLIVAAGSEASPVFFLISGDFPSSE